jgi:peptidoglycan/LPS O-acetylase OafA/YrhL
MVIGLIIITIATKIPLWKPRIDLSYGIYLTHAPLIQFSILLGLYQDTYWFLAFILLTSASLAYLGYRYIEMPFVSLGKRIAKNKSLY